MAHAFRNAVRHRAGGRCLMRRNMSIELNGVFNENV